MRKDLTQAEALAIVQQVWSRAYAHEQRRFKGNEQPGPDGWIRPAGEIYGYSVGYHRTGKRGARLSTEKGYGESFVEALLNALHNTIGTRAHEPLKRALKNIKTETAS